MRLAPSVRFLFWVALVLVPAVTLAVALPATLMAAALFSSLLLAVAVADAWLSRDQLSGFRIELPELLRLLKGRAAELPLFLVNPGGQGRIIRLAPELPDRLRPTQLDHVVRLPAEAERSRLDIELLPLSRGNFRIRRCHVEHSSPLGLWDIRRALPVDCEVRVYPDLSTERKSLAALFLNRGPLGVHLQRQIGKGREFEKLREYLPGDSVDEIHWKASAKRGHPVTKVFQIERTQEVYVVIDASRLTARLSTIQQEGDVVPATVLERFVTSALVLGAAAQRQGDLFGLLTFSDRIHSFLRARNGQAHYSACRDALHDLEPRVVAPDYDELFTFLRLRLRRRALLVILTALDDPVLAESFLKNVELVRRQHLILVNMLQPAGAEPIFSHPNVTTLDSVYEKLGGHLIFRSLRELDGKLSSRGVRFALLEDARLSAQLVTQYLTVKQRQQL